MAKADLNFPLGRNPGSYSVYKMRGVERLIIRTKALLLLGSYDQEFEVVSKQLFERIIDKEFFVYFSEVNDTELEFAPEHVRKVKTLIPPDYIIRIEINDEAESLAQTYIRERALRKSSENDAYHIALASVNRLDCLISWNFKHIVNFDKIKIFNSINIRLGYPFIDIRSPLEFIKDEN